MNWLIFAVFIPFVVALVIPFLFKYLPRIHTGWFVLVIPIVLFIFFAGHVKPISNGEVLTSSFAWIPSIDFYFTVYLDGLSLLLTLIITGIGALVVLYSIFYLAKEREALHNFYIYLLLFMGAMLGVVLSDNIMVLYVFWELTSISSFLLIAYWFQRERSRYGAQKSLLITVFGGFNMLAGFLILYFIGDSFSVRELIGQAEHIANHALFVPAMVLILIGAFTKSAQFPFHIWLPDAMEAPTPISAYLHSATMVKAGIYLVARFTPIFGGNMTWFWLVMLCGVVTMLWGSIMAIKQNDLKALLAYSTISQLGLIMSLLGLGSAALNPDYSQYALLFSGSILAAMFHLVNHSVFKGTLFMVIGILDHETGTRDIRRLGGLMSIMPISFTLTIIGGFSMAGLPPFSGFLSKEMFFDGVLNASTHMDAWLSWLPYVVWIGSVFTFVYCFILIFKSFTGTYEPQKFDREPKEASIGMLISPIILAGAVIGLFFFPNSISTIILEPTMQSIMPNLLASGERFVVDIQLWHGWNTEILMTLGIVALGSALYFTHHRWKETVYNNLSHKLTLNYAYDQLLVKMEKVSATIMRFHMTGNIRDYVMYIFVFIIVVLGGSLLVHYGIHFDLSNDSSITWYEGLLVLLTIISAIAIIFVKTRLAAIIVLSALGFMVSLFYVIFRAPDLALTQLVVETITTALFVLCFYYLPRMKKELNRLPLNMTKLFISIGVGVTLTIVGLSVHAHRLGEPISSYFHKAYELAGAKNIVNAILVDFRGFDTMLEIVVLFIAGIGIYSLNVLRRARREQQ